MKIIHALVIKLAIQIGFQCDYCSEIIIDDIITHQLSLSGYAISRMQMYLEQCMRDASVCHSVKHAHVAQRPPTVWR